MTPQRQQRSVQRHRIVVHHTERDLPACGSRPVQQSVIRSADAGVRATPVSQTPGLTIRVRSTCRRNVVWVCPQTTTSASSPANNSRTRSSLCTQGERSSPGRARKGRKGFPGTPCTTTRSSSRRPEKAACSGRLANHASRSLPSRSRSQATRSRARGMSHFSGHSDEPHSARYSSELPRITWHGTLRSRSTTSAPQGNL